MNVRRNDPGDNAATDKDDESMLERVAKTIAPPSREVSDAELIDPGSNSPVPKPTDPAKVRSARTEQKRDGDDADTKHDK